VAFLRPQIAVWFYIFFEYPKGKIILCSSQG